MSQTEDSAPGTLFSWVAAAGRAGRPGRWGLCLAGVVVSLLWCALMSVIFSGRCPVLQQLILPDDRSDC